MTYCHIIFMYCELERTISISIVLVSITEVEKQAGHRKSGVLVAGRAVKHCFKE